LYELDSGRQVSVALLFNVEISKLDWSHYASMNEVSPVILFLNWKQSINGC
jgi:hypothetical protein